jgi:hypothetical protein
MSTLVIGKDQHGTGKIFELEGNLTQSFFASNSRISEIPKIAKSESQQNMFWFSLLNH